MWSREDTELEQNFAQLVKSLAKRPRSTADSERVCKRELATPRMATEATSTAPPPQSLSLELQYKVLFERKNTRQVLSWGVPSVMIAAELALLPRVFEARTLGQLVSSGLASSLLGLLSYQLFDHHKHRKQLDEQWLLQLERQTRSLQLHAPRRHGGNSTLDGTWLHRQSATLIWNSVMLAGAGLPIAVIAFRARRML